MSKIELIDDAIGGGLPSRLPAAFWFHFPDGRTHGPAAVEAQIEFLNETDVDLVKIMNENLHPSRGLVTSAAGWADFRPMRASDPEVRDQLDIVKRTIDAVGDRARVLVTVHGVVASVFHASGRVDDYEAGRSTLVEHLRADPRRMRSVYRGIAESMAELAEACIDAGADGIYYAALGGERSNYTDEEFAEFVEPNDRLVLDAAARDGRLNVLHICKEDIDFARYRGYGAPVVSWSTAGNDLPIDAARRIFPDATLLGGIDNFSTLFTEGTDAEAAQLAREAIEAVSDHRRFILGADCTLPSSTPLSRIRAMVDIAHATTLS